MIKIMMIIILGRRPDREIKNKKKENFRFGDLAVLTDNTVKLEESERKTNTSTLLGK